MRRLRGAAKERSYMATTDDSSEIQDDVTSDGPAKVIGSTSAASGVRAWIKSYAPLPELTWSRNVSLLHIVLGILVVLVGSVFGASFGGYLDSLDVVRPSSSGEGPTATGAASLIAFQASMFFWPFLVTKAWQGRGVAKDWGAKLRLADISTGIVAAVVALVVVPLTAGLVSSIVGLEDQREAGNTSFITEAEGSPLLIVLVFGAVIGAPVAEEMFFRGLVQRSLQRFGGKVVGVLGSTVLFALPHFTGAALKPTIVLLVSISTIGVLFGTIVAITNRLGPTIIAHIIFNSVVVGATLVSGGG